MTVKELKDLLGQFPDSWEVRVTENSVGYYTDVDEIREMTEPTFDKQGNYTGEAGIGAVELLTK